MTEFLELKLQTDLAAIRTIADQIWPATYCHILSREQISYMMEMMYSQEVMARELMHEHIRFFRFDVDGEAVGFLSLGPTKEHECVKLHKLYLLLAYQGKGYGSLMLQFAINIARNEGYKILHLNVNKHNQRALRAYERNGFVILRSEINSIGNDFVMDDFVMEKIL